MRTIVHNFHVSRLHSLLWCHSIFDSVSLVLFFVLLRVPIVANFSHSERLSPLSRPRVFSLVDQLRVFKFSYLRNISLKFGWGFFLSCFCVKWQWFTAFFRRAQDTRIYIWNWHAIAQRYKAFDSQRRYILSLYDTLARINLALTHSRVNI